MSRAAAEHCPQHGSCTGWPSLPYRTAEELPQGRNHLACGTGGFLPPSKEAHGSSRKQGQVSFSLGDLEGGF